MREFIMEKQPKLSLLPECRKPRSKAQATIEFALALLPLLIVIFSIIDASLLFQAWLSVQNVARQTVRYAVTGEYNSAYCPDLNGDGVACKGTAADPNVARAQKEAEEDVARFVSIHAYADTQIVGLMDDPAATILDPRYIQVTVCGNNLFRGRNPVDGAYQPYQKWVYLTPSELIPLGHFMAVVHLPKMQVLPDM